MKKIRPSSVILLLVLYTLLAAAWIWRSNQSNAGPMAQDGRLQMQEEIAGYFLKAPKDHAMPALMGLVSLPDEELNALSNWVRMAPVSQIRQLTVQPGPVDKLGPEWREFLLDTWLVHEAPVDLLEAHLMVAAAGDRLNADARRGALEYLANRALAQGASADAVTILGRANELEGATWETLKKLATACRTAQNTAPALRALSIWINRHKIEDMHPALEEARDLELSLMLEAGLAPEALSLHLDQFLGHAPYPERMLDRAFLAARHAHQGSRLLPVLERHLETFPEHEMTAAHLTQESRIHPDYLRWLACHAAICDEEQPGSVAFKSYLRLAAARDPKALPRLCLLAATPGMKEEAGQALRSALDQAEMQLTALQLAQKDPIAQKVLSDRLRAAPENQSLHFAATLAAAAARTSGSTAILWQDYLRRFPGDLAARRRLIQAYIEEQQPALALRAYEQLPKDKLTEDERQEQDLLRQL